MNKIDSEYFRLLRDILTNGRKKNNRTGVSTTGVFGAQAKFPVSMDAFPILTTKRVWFKGIVHELLWFIKGDTNIKYLVDNDVHIWDEWAYARYCKTYNLGTEFEGKPLETWAMSQDEFVDTIKTDNDFAQQWGQLGEGTYGSMWRAFPYYQEAEFAEGPIYSDGFGNISRGKVITEGTVDQLSKVIDKLKTNPDDRRMIVSAWHPYWVDHCALPPCHCLFHFNTEELTLEERVEILQKTYGPVNLPPNETWIIQKLNEDNIPTRRLNLLLYQRSSDIFLGVPFNISSYSLLLAMVAHCVGMEPGVFTHTYGDLHIYENHMNQVTEQLSREPKELPKLWLNPEKRDLFSFTYDDIKLIEYNSHPKIEAPIAV